MSSNYLLTRLIDIKNVFIYRNLSCIIELNRMYRQCGWILQFRMRDFPAVVQFLSIGRAQQKIRRSDWSTIIPPLFEFIFKRMRFSSNTSIVVMSFSSVLNGSGFLLDDEEFRRVLEEEEIAKRISQQSLFPPRSPAVSPEADVEDIAASSTSRRSSVNLEIDGTPDSPKSVHSQVSPPSSSRVAPEPVVEEVHVEERSTSTSSRLRAVARLLLAYPDIAGSTSEWLVTEMPEEDW